MSSRKARSLVPQETLGLQIHEVGHEKENLPVKIPRNPNCCSCAAAKLHAHLILVVQNFA